MSGIIMFRPTIILLVCLVASTHGVPVQQSRSSRQNFVPKIQNTFEIIKINQSPAAAAAAFSSTSSTGDIVSLAVEFFASYAQVPKKSIRISSFHTSDHNQVTHVYLQQVIHGHEVSNGVGNVNIDKNGQIISVGNSFFTGHLPPNDENSFQPKLSAKEAVEAFGKYLNVPTIGELSQTERTESVSRNGGSGFMVSGAAFAVKDIPAVLKYIQFKVTPEAKPELSQVWNLEVRTEKNMYNSFVHGNDGQVMALIDWISDASYNVYPFGINDPESGDRTIVQNPANPIASPDGWHSRIHKDGHGHGHTKETRTTIGNNVFAQENHDGDPDYLFGYRPYGGKELNFDFPINLELEPETYVDAAVTNLFYWNNIIHDLFYLYGFDEKAGNFQEKNFKQEQGHGHGHDDGSVNGKGSDAVIAQAQDGSGTNNAWFATPPDGENGMMVMFLWDQTNPSRDGDLEGGIIMHEYAHGISNRLTGGRNNVDCLADGEPGGMGEGWGDTFATITRVTASTTRDQNYAMGDYVWGDPAGIRRYLYSTDLTTNPSTYNFVVRPGYEEVHAKGEVWAVILYEVFWNLVEKNGFDPDWFNPTSTGGNVKMLQLLIDGMKLQPCNPNFVQARDAILQADQINYGGDNNCALWEGFAKRGLGTEAQFEGVESFAIPGECE